MTKNLSALIKPASSLCNMRCTYCFYHDVSSHREVRSFGMMTTATMQKVIDLFFNELNDGDSITFAFQGGEPTLIGLPFFEDFVAYVHTKNPTVSITVDYSLQTNGTKIDEAFCLFLKENNFLVGLSIDLDKEFHDENRIFEDNKGTYARVIQTKKLFDAYGVTYNVLCVLTNKIARFPQKVFKALLRDNIKFIQFIPCLDELDSDGPTPFALTPARFFSFYDGLFTLWKDEFFKGNYISIKLFDDIVYLLRTGIPASCGLLGQCSNQMVIESDGSVYPCDFYVLDDYKLGTVQDNTMDELYKSENLSTFLSSNAKAPCSYCTTCPFFKMCYGGCKRMRGTMYVDEKNQACGYRQFLEGHLDELMQIAK